MSERVYKRNTPIYVLLIGGEVTYTSDRKDDVLYKARKSVEKYIKKYFQNYLPFELSECGIRWIDVEVHQLTGETSYIPLPYQAWVDGCWQEIEEEKREEEEREYKNFVKLRERYEERFQIAQAQKQAEKTGGTL